MKTNPIELTIVKKTTKTVTFTVKNENRYLESFNASNGILIRTIAYPQYNADESILYTQGNIKHCDDEEIKVSISVFKQISAAVAEYNEKFGPKPADKLTLKIEIVSTNSTSDVVAFKIVEQSGFVTNERYKFGGVTFVSCYEPVYNSIPQVLYVQGLTAGRSGNVICVTSEEFNKIEAAIKLLNDSTPKLIEKITFLYNNDGVKTRRCLNVLEKNGEYYYGIDEDKSEPRRFLVKKMSKIEAIR